MTFDKFTIKAQEAVQEAVNTAQVVGGLLIIGGILIATLQRPHLPVRKENS